MADSYTSSLLSAISTLANKTTEELSNDTTIRAVISKCTDASLKEYLATYNGGDITVYAQDGSSASYSVGDSVYVLIPQGNMDNRKYIIGISEDSIATEDDDITVAADELLSNYNIVGTNVISLKEYEDTANNGRKVIFPLSLDCNDSGVNYLCYSYSDVGKDDFTCPRLVVDEDSLCRNMSQSDAILIKMDLFTNIPTGSRGDYGIIVTINSSAGPIVYTLNTAKMTGDPMKYYGVTTQYIICHFKDIDYNNIDSIVAYTSNGYTSGYITITDLQIYALASNNATDGDYKLCVTTPLGNYLDELTTQSVQINAKMIYAGSYITDDTSFYWGIRNNTITISSSSYNSKLGSGYEYLSDGSSLTIDYTQALAKNNEIRCVAVYGTDVVLTQNIIIYNTSSSYEINIISDQGNTFYNGNGYPTLTCTINDKSSKFSDMFTDSEFSFVWSKLNNDNIFTFEDDLETLLAAKNNATSNDDIVNYTTKYSLTLGHTFKKGINGNQLTIAVDNTFDSLTYYCTVYRNGVSIGTASFYIENKTRVVSQQSYIEIENDYQLFQYNEQGLSPAETASPIEIKYLTMHFIDPISGSYITKDVDYYWELPTAESLIIIPAAKVQNNRYNGQTFPLSILSTYSINATDNQLTAVATYNNEVFKQTTHLTFTKIGENGTNGTAITGKISQTIQPDDSNSKLTIIKNYSGNPFYNAIGTDNSYVTLNGTAPLRASVYKNNEKQSGCSTKWSLQGRNARTYSINESTSELSLNTITSNNILLDYRTIKAQISFANKKYFSYFNMPMIEYLNSDYTYTNMPIKIINNQTLDYVYYDANCTNPQYNSSLGVGIQIPTDLYNSSTITWKAESGPATDNGYSNPNFLLSFIQGDKTGSSTISIQKMEENINSLIARLDEAKSSEDSEMVEDLTTQFNQLFSKNLSSTDLIYCVNELLESIYNDYYSVASSSWTNEGIRQVYDTFTEIITSITNDYNSVSSYNAQLQQNKIDIYNYWGGSGCDWLNFKNITGVKVINKDGTSVSNGVVGIGTVVNDALSIGSGDTQRKLVQWDSKGNQVSISEVDFATLVYNTYFNPSNTNSKFYQMKGLYIDNIWTSLPSNSNIASVLTEQKEAFQDAYAAIKMTISNYMSGIGTINEDTDFSALFKAMSNWYNIIRLNYTSNMRDFTINASTIGYSQAYKEYLLNDDEDDMTNLQVYIIPKDTFSSSYLNNNVSITITNTSTSKDIARIIVPICFSINDYSLSSINGWDGTGIEINEDENYILSPRIGAGVKDDSTNTFTGIVMGSLNNATSTGYNAEEQVGLMGFSNGQQSIMLNAKNGSACFGIADGSETEGRIELIPGGTSKIANWNIGKNFLYASSTNNFEIRADSDARTGTASSKKMIPSNSYGIILSSDMPYMHIKGKPFDAAFVNKANRNSEGYDSINPGDSLEIRLDPDDNSLFSIWRYTNGVDAEDMSKISVGWYTESADGIKTVKDFNINKSDYDVDNLTFVTYYLPTTTEDNIDYYTPYFRVGSDNFTYDFTRYNGEDTFKSSLSDDHDISLVSNPTGSIDYLTGEVIVSNYQINKDTYGIPKLIYKDSDGQEISVTDNSYTYQVTNENSGTYTDTVGTIIIGTVTEPEDNTTINKTIDFLNLEVRLNSQESISLNQSINFSGILSNSDIYGEYPIQFRIVLKDFQGDIVAATELNNIGTYENNIFTLYPIAENSVIPIGTYTAALNIVGAENHEYKYLYTMDINATYEINTDLLPEYNKAPLYYEQIGTYGAARNAYVIQNDDADLVKISFDTNGFGVPFIQVRNLTTKNIAVALYNKRLVDDNENIVSNITLIKNKESDDSYHDFYINGYTSSYDNWNIAIYEIESNEALDESIICSTNPKYILKSIEAVAANETYLSFTLNKPTDATSLVPQNKNYLCITKSSSIGTGIQGIPIAETCIKNGNKTLTLYSYDADSLSSIITDAYPFVDWTDDGDSHVMYLRALSQEEVAKNSEFISNKKVTWSNLTESSFTQYLQTKEYIQVGIDENGKFYTAGTSNQKVSSRLGPVRAFNYCSGLYGQEITRTKDNNTSQSILKIFTDDNDSTYFTAGQSANNNINILTNGAAHSINIGTYKNPDTSETTPYIPSLYNGLTINNSSIEFSIGGIDNNNTITINKTNIEDLNTLFTHKRAKQINDLFDNPIQENGTDTYVSNRLNQLLGTTNSLTSDDISTLLLLIHFIQDDSSRLTYLENVILEYASKQKTQ